MKKALKNALYVVSSLLIMVVASAVVKYAFSETLGTLFINNKKVKDDSKDIIAEYIKDINKIAPIKVDSVTTFLCMTYSGNVIQYNMQISDDAIPYIDKQYFKDVSMDNLITSGGDKFIHYLINRNMFINYAIYDSNKKLHFIIKISPNDFNKRMKK